MNNINYLKERLSNRLEWKDYYETVLKHKVITNQVREEYYQDKALLYLILSIYYLPLNIWKYFRYLKDVHYYSMITKEIEVLKKAIINIEENL